ncbi:hypothetical protein ABIE65_004941 [Constrictibacter sp. MBR-5]|jgi:hypothetical protein|uniref:DUF2628 domain-containing protein n=1 Tax=Constrictibacter sp. MBR-5 TaxID=3156467 RepID=UPI003395FBCA
MKMRMWTTHLHDAGLYSGPEVLVVKDGFCWPAFFLTFVWALWHRMWLTAVLLLAGSLAVGAGGELAGLSQTAQAALGLGFSIFIGTSANDWRRASLRRRGWDDGSSVVAANREAAEWRLFQHDEGMVLR